MTCLFIRKVMSTCPANTIGEVRLVECSRPPLAPPPFQRRFINNVDISTLQLLHNFRDRRENVAEDKDKD